MAYPYPPGFPSSEIADTVAAFKSGTVTSPHEVHCLWAIVGYGLSKLAPDAQAAVTPLNTLSPAACGAHLASTSVDLIDWKTVIKIIIGMIENYFSA